MGLPRERAAMWKGMSRIDAGPTIGAGPIDGATHAVLPTLVGPTPTPEPEPTTPAPPGSVATASSARHGVRRRRQGGRGGTRW
jgi:hypothetical protein